MNRPQPNMGNTELAMKSRLRTAVGIPANPMKVSVASATANPLAIRIRKAVMVALWRLNIADRWSRPTCAMRAFIVPWNAPKSAPKICSAAQNNSSSMPVEWNMLAAFCSHWQRPCYGHNPAILGPHKGKTASPFSLCHNRIRVRPNENTGAPRWPRSKTPKTRSSWNSRGGL